MPKILLLGNGYVAGPCLDYLLKRKENTITVASRNLANSIALSAGRPCTTGIALDVTNKKELEAEIEKHDLVISLIPYTFHCLVIEAAIAKKKHVVTTSYVSEQMAAFDSKAKEANVTIFNEVGVDPGIDHLYAIKTIEEVHAKGGKIIDFLSYCGGLPAPECSNNPLGYKFSWSSRGVLLALRNDAKYLKDGKVEYTPGKDLMNIAKPIYIYPAFAFEGYPNRDSTPYTKRYNIPECQNLIRGTLRYQGFPKFVKALSTLGFLDDSVKDYLKKDSPEIEWKQVLANALGISNTDKKSLVDAVVAKTHIEGDERNRIIEGLSWLGLFSSQLVTKRENLLDTLCATLEEKMQYESGERDMVMLQHKFGIEWPTHRETRTSTGLWFGVPNGDSAMSTTVGVPCAITTQLILDGVITKRGVLAPMSMDLVAPILAELEKTGIRMEERIL